jgi:hypothetical protein
MVWLAAALFALIGLVVYAAREPLARGQALILGGRIGPGCVIAEAIGFLVVAVLVILFRELLA